MAKRKLQRFAENETLPNVVQPTREELLDGFALQGNWRKDHFKNENPIVLELGCGKGEYTVGLARKFPGKNFIGIDVKGSRMWRGAKTAVEEGMSNASFLRIQIEMLEYCFAKNEVDEIWITFPDPQIKYKRARKRLTAPMFLDRYKKLLNEEGVMHLKTDSAFLHGYTLGVIELLGHTVQRSTHDLYNSDVVDDIRSIQTYYESKYLEQGIPITYIRFQING